MAYRVAVADDSGGWARVDRLERYAAVAESLARLSDRRLRDLLDGSAVVGTGIGGTTSVVHVDGTPVFVKQVPLTDLERRPEHVMSTANLFDLPLGCQYGVGSPSFGVWRELAALATTSSWVLAGRTAAFPLLYHWRVLDDCHLALSDELADVETAVAHWDGSSAVRRRIEAIAGATAAVTVFLEYVPFGLEAWMEEHVGGDEPAAEAAITMVHDALRRDVAFMNAAGVFHFDAHLGNILTDGHRLYLADFGLATSPRYELTAAEEGFLARNRSHDPCHTVTRLVDWLVTHLTGRPHWTERDELVRRWAEGEEPADVLPAAARIITRYAPIAVVVNDFYRRLHTEDRSTPYPADEVERACAATGFDL